MGYLSLLLFFYYYRVFLISMNIAIDFSILLLEIALSADNNSRAQAASRDTI